MNWRILHGDVRERLSELPAGSVQTCVTSPPYWGLRDYGTATWDGGDPACDHKMPVSFKSSTLGASTGGRSETTHQRSIQAQASPYAHVCGKCGAKRIDNQIGLEPTPDAFVASMVAVFREVRRVLADDATLWLNLGDSYASNAATAHNPAKHAGGFDSYRGSDTPTLNTDQQGRIAYRGNGIKAKDLIGIPWRVAFALQADGWYLRSDIIWAKGNPMPESVTDRPTKSHEYIFLLSKQAKYYYDADAIREAHTHPDAYLNTGDWAKSVKQTGAADALPAARAANRAVAMSRPKDYIGHVNGRNKRSVWLVNTQPFTDWAQTVRRVRVAPGDADGDTKRITSPDCPVHGDHSALVATALYGERGADDSIRTARTDTGLVPSLLDGSAPTEMSHEPDSVGRSSDSRPLACSDSAIGRSTQSRRTGHVPVTTAPCSVSAGRGGGTGGTSASRESGEPSGHSPESRSGRAASGAHLSAETIDRIAHSVSSVESCICELYKEITEEMSHFATYPEKLIEPCILAGTSEKGQCPACGKPWMRVTERSVPTHQSQPDDYMVSGRRGFNRERIGEAKQLIYAEPLAVVSRKIWDAARARSLDNVKAALAEIHGAEVATALFNQWTRLARTGNTNQASYPSDSSRVWLMKNLGIDLPLAVEVGGWQPSCACDAGEPVPQTVLDPFTGSGTTGAVAIRLGRSFVGCELNRDYIQLAEKRIGAVAPLFASGEVA